MTNFVSVSLRDPSREPSRGPLRDPAGEPVRGPILDPVRISAGELEHDPAHESAPDYPLLSVNGIVISPAMIERASADCAGAPEPAATAKCALVLHQLLHQRAAALGLPLRNDADADTDDASREADETLLEQLLDLEASMPAPTEAECRRYYDAHPEVFRPGDLAQVRHILFGVTAGVPVQALLARAEATLHELRADPGRFAERAAELSNCRSGKVGGSLGQIGRDDCVPEFAAAVFGTETSGTETSARNSTAVLPRLVRTRFGFHIVQVERRIDGVRLPFEMVQAQIAHRLAERVRLKAAQQYVRLLAASARIEGVAFDAATSPLVQ